MDIQTNWAGTPPVGTPPTPPAGDNSAVLNKDTPPEDLTKKELESREKRIAELEAHNRKLQSSSDVTISKLKTEIDTLKRFHDTEWLTIEEKYQALEARYKKEQELREYQDRLNNEDKTDTIFTQAKSQLSEMWMDEKSETWKLFQSLLKDSWDDAEHVLSFALKILWAVRKDVESFEDTDETPPADPAKLWSWLPGAKNIPPAWWNLNHDRNVFATWTDEEKDTARKNFWAFLNNLKFNN